MNCRSTPGPPSPAKALEAGIADAALRGPDYRQVFWGVYISSRITLTLAVRSLAALMVSPAGAVVSHHTAARLWGGTPPETGDLHLTMPPGNRAKAGGIRAHRIKVAPAVVSHRGLPVTSPERTFLDLAKDCDVVQLVVLGDSLVRKGASRYWPMVAESWVVVTVPSFGVGGPAPARVVGAVHLLVGYAVLGQIVARTRGGA